jgi:hypothetical protein
MMQSFQQESYTLTMRQKSQIPPDLVVKFQLIDIVDVIL